MNKFQEIRLWIAMIVTTLVLSPIAFYEDMGLVYIDTEAVIKHLVKGTENTNDTTQQYQTY